VSLPRALGRLARVFYRRIEAAGIANVPESGPVLFVANHANGLVDPILVLALVSRPITFVAKSTLWKIPVLGALLDALGAVPVVRRVDATDAGCAPNLTAAAAGADRNEASLHRLAEALDAGGAVLIFPEGRSHSDPFLSPIHTGAARVLLLARRDVAVIPVGIWFARKEEFRSDVLVQLGAPLTPEDRSVGGWTQAIEDGLRAVTLNGRSWADHEAASAVEAIYGSRLEAAAGDGVERGELARSFRTRHLLLDARRVLAQADPGAVESLQRRARAYRRLGRRAGVDETAPSGDALSGVLGESVRSLVRLPFAVAGTVAFFVPYRLVRFVTNAILPRDQRDQIALYKLLSGLVLYAATFALELAAVARLFGARAALAAGLLLPVCGLAALRALDESERDAARLRRRVLGWSRKVLLERLAAEREALIAECDRLAEVYRRATEPAR
jgi:glycerol-3-phosphate O-acyltransferase/dihydroxyacetone phosphate acyltransferase